MSIHVEEHVWITLSDGCRLGARLWLPPDWQDKPVPAILEYIPYRKRDGTRVRDEPMHGFYAMHGYAAVRVDMRGTGESDGFLADEYLKLEQDDAVEVIAWIADQAWCDGNVGMQGKSWGGFNSLQVAARRPPALKAIITTFSTDNRFTDDIHFMGGCLLNDNLWWGAIMMVFQARPLDPAIVGDDWRARWLERIETLPFFAALWLEHQRFDDYWKHGSVCTDYDAIECPVLAVGGWADSYTNSVPRLLAGLDVPRLGIIGPWGHVYPHDGIPGPAIGFLQEAVRWWDQWLKGEDSGIMREPMLRAYVQEAVPPATSREFVEGRWVGLAQYPSPDVGEWLLHLREDGSLGEASGPQDERSIRSPQSHGRAGGEWMSAGCPGEHPADQRLDDGGALVFETPPLSEAVSILGVPRLDIQLSADAPVAYLVVRLSDVGEDGSVTRVSYQVLNLTHRNGHEHPEPLEVGQFYDVSVTLNACGHRFLPGHRVRIAIATTYWPMIWPAPYPATLTIRTGIAALKLPVMRDDGLATAFPPVARGELTPMTQVDPGVVRRYSTQDHVTGEMTYVTETIGGVFGEGVLRLDEIGTQIAHGLKRELTIRDDDPLSARYLLTQTFEMGREGWNTRIETRTEMHATRETFRLNCVLTAWSEGEVLATRTWNEAIPRDLL